MKSSFEYSLLETGESIKKGYSMLLQNIGKTTAVITGIIAVLVTFTEIGFCDITKDELTTTVIMMVIASYLIFFSLVDAGEKLGKQTEEYQKAEIDYIAKKSKISGDDVICLREFCKNYTSDELKFRKQNALSHFGYAYLEYENYKNGDEASKSARKVFKKIDRIKPINLTPAELLFGCKGGKKSEFANPEKFRFFKLLLGLIPSSICMLFTVSVMLSAKEGLGFAEVVEGLLKLSTLPIVGLKGYSAGYTYAKNEAVFWLETKTRLLEAFLDKKENISK